MANLFTVQESLLGAIAGQGGYSRRTQMRRTWGILLSPKPSCSSYYRLHFAATISASCALLKRKGKYISESESCDSSDFEEDKYPPGEGARVFEPHVVEFPSYAAMEEEKFWTELLAFPWQRGRTERFRRRLEEKYFPKHGLDCMLLPAYRKKNKVPEATFSKSASSSSSSAPLSSSRLSSAGFPDDQVYKKLDYPTIAKALSPAAEGKESFRSKRSQPSAAKEGSSISVDGESFFFDTSPTIRTIRAPLSSTEGGPEGHSPPSVHSSDAAVVDLNDAAVTDKDIIGECGAAGIVADKGDASSEIDSEQPIDLLNEEDEIPLMPPVLKRGMVPPQRWNEPGGTVVLIDKPKGWTSFTVCEKIRKLVRVKKVGHAGTLDPMATGLLVVCVGPATKIVDKYQALYKVYAGTFRLGEGTSSCDADSPVNERKPWEHIADADIQAAKEAFMGEILQIPPMFSAIKVEGERLYEKARRGEHLDIPARKVTVYELLIERDRENRQELVFVTRCSKGTYIRSLCADFGRALKSCAHLTSLRRVQIGKLHVDDAWTIEDLTDAYTSLSPPLPPPPPPPNS